MSVVGYVGLGNMGGALARRLQDEQPLVVLDRDPEAVRTLVEAGARAATDLAALAAECDVVLLCLPTSDHVRSVVLGPGGLADGLRPGALVVDQTTGDPKVTREIAAELAGRGIELVDAPVSGGTAGARNGTISIMVGAGDEQYARVAPLLALISPNVVHAGAVGAGHTIKLVNNLLSCAQRVLTQEALTLAAKNGVEPEVALQILLAGGARNAYLERVVGPDLLTGAMSAGFTLGLAHKDLRLACQLGTDSGVPLFYGNLTREMYQMSISEHGRDARVDTTALTMDRLAGTGVVPRS